MIHLNSPTFLHDAVSVVDNFLEASHYQDFLKTLPLFDSVMTPKPMNPNNHDAKTIWLARVRNDSAPQILYRDLIYNPQLRLWKNVIDTMLTPLFFTQITHLLNINSLYCNKPLTTRIRLVKETNTCFLKPHYDRPQKFLTLILYLSPETELKDAGTSFYLESGEDDFTVDYVSNRAVIVKHPNRTLHGVKRRNLMYPRYTLQQFWEVDLTT